MQGCLEISFRPTQIGLATHQSFLLGIPAIADLVRPEPERLATTQTIET